MQFEKLPEPGTMAAELVGDVSQFDDERLRRLQEISQISSFSIGAAHMHFKRHGLSDRDLEISRRGWCIAKPGGIAHKIAQMPLKWSDSEVPSLLYGEDEGHDFTGFEGRFLPTIGQRVASALAILDVHPINEANFGLGIIAKARRDLSEILVRFPVLMHPMIQVVNTRGPKSPVTLYPLPLALQLSHSGVLPSRQKGCTPEQLERFANHSCVQIALDRKLTKEALNWCGANRGLHEGNRIAGPLNKTAGSNYDFALSAMALQAHRHEPKESWMAFATLDMPPEKSNSYPGDFHDFANTIAHYVSRDSESRKTFVENQAMQKMALLANFETLSMYAPIAAALRNSEKPSSELVTSTVEILDGLGIERDASRVVKRLFATATKWSLNDEHGVEQFVESLAPFLESCSELRQFMGTCQLPIPPVWDRVLAVHENREVMELAIEQGIAEAHPSVSSDASVGGCERPSPRVTRRGL